LPDHRIKPSTILLQKDTFKQGISAKIKVAVVQQECFVAFFLSVMLFLFSIYVLRHLQNILTLSGKNVPDQSASLLMHSSHCLQRKYASACKGYCFFTFFRDIPENIQLDFKRAYHTWLNGNAEKSMFKSNKRSRREIPGIELRQKKLAIFNEQRGLLSSAEQEGIDIADERNVMVL